MLASANHNKPLHVFRRFVEGPFSVYLSIFLLTLAVRLLFFIPRVPVSNPAFMANSDFKTYYVLRYSARCAQFLEPATAGVENDSRFGRQNRVTTN